MTTDTRFLMRQVRSMIACALRQLAATAYTLAGAVDHLHPADEIALS